MWAADHRRSPPITADHRLEPPESRRLYVRRPLADPPTHLIPPHPSPHRSTQIRIHKDLPAVTMWFENPVIGLPTKADGNTADNRLFPAECRGRGLTYAAPLNITVCRQVGEDGAIDRISKELGRIPVMTRSEKCHLYNLTPEQLVRRHEEAGEFGGTFICNGLERLVRMLQVPRRNHIMAVTRGAYQNRGPSYTTKGCSIRCVRNDMSSITVTMHALDDGNASVRFSLRKSEFFIPVVMVLKCLKDCTDQEIFDKVIAGDSSNAAVAARLGETLPGPWYTGACFLPGPCLRTCQGVGIWTCQGVGIWTF